ncbi:MAG: 2,3-bisphosphoglycerate-independent phosphoglycerate mutase, partial [Deltaproteobacteria bacterium]|nr:2,3-bisphosphoglycerate-independent phosphoglycerate mutase [Deltaproteobacteria bacterium]
TAHTLNPVPFIIVSEKFKNLRLKKSGGLSNVAPTLLEILKIEKPKEMTGESLIEHP